MQKLFALRGWEKGRWAGRYMGEENEVFEASVEVGLLFQTHDLLKVGVVDVCIHSEQPLEYCPHHIPEINWEWSTCNETQIINITLQGQQQKNSWKHLEPSTFRTRAVTNKWLNVQSPTNPIGWHPSMDVRPHQHGKFHSSIHIWPGHPKKDKLLATSFAEGLFHSKFSYPTPTLKTKNGLNLLALKRRWSSSLKQLQDLHAHNYAVHIPYQVFEGRWIHHRAVLQSSPLSTPHTWVPRPPEAS